MSICALLLAAGAGSRFGSQPKLLSQLHNRSLLRVSLEPLEALLPGRVWVVLGAHARQLQQELQASHPVHNRHWAQGLSRSIQAGMAALPADASAVLIALADQPLIGHENFQHLLELHQQTGLAVCASFEQTLSVPALIPQRHFAALNQLSGDRGAKALLSRWQVSGELVALPMAQAALDVDTPADLVRVNQQTTRITTGGESEKNA